MKEEVENLLKTSKFFEDNARFDVSKERYAMAMFHLEQALQLLLKAFLLNTLGTFKKTHDLHVLFDDVSKIVPEIKEIHEKNWLIIERLREAYIGARYFGFIYSKEEVENAFKLIDGVRKCLNLK